MGLKETFFGAQGAIGQGTLAAAVNAQQSSMMQQLAAQQANMQGKMIGQSWPYSEPIRMTLAFREVEGGYLATYALAQGEVYKEVLCATLEEVSKLVFRMAAEKAMR